MHNQQRKVSMKTISQLIKNPAGFSGLHSSYGIIQLQGLPIASLCFNQVKFQPHSSSLPASP